MVQDPAAKAHQWPNRRARTALRLTAPRNSLSRRVRRPLLRLGGSGEPTRRIERLLDYVAFVDEQADHYGKHVQVEYVNLEWLPNHESPRQFIAVVVADGHANGAVDAVGRAIRSELGGNGGGQQSREGEAR